VRYCEFTRPKDPVRYVKVCEKQNFLDTISDKLNRRMWDLGSVPLIYVATLGTLSYHLEMDEGYVFLKRI
jgi:hypothetical protein